MLSQEYPYQDSQTVIFQATVSSLQNQLNQNELLRYNITLDGIK